MRKENAAFRTAFVSEEGSQLQNRDYFAYVELDSHACYVAADSLDAEQGKNSAKIVVECILREFMEHPSLSAASIKRNLHKAHRELLHDREGLRLRASVSLVVTDYAKIRYVTVGNARFAMVRNGRMLYESRDQSLTENLVEKEELPKDKAAVHEERNNLYSCLGQPFGRFIPQISKKRKLADGDILLLYTRGVWENVDSRALLDASRDVSTPQDVADNVEDLILGRQAERIDNYTIAATFVDKTWRNPKKRWTAKKILAVALPVALILLALGITLFVRWRIREGRREDMEACLRDAQKYVSWENYDKAAEEYEKAGELAKKLKLSDQQEEIGNALLCTEQIRLADQTLADGDYEKARELYGQAQKLSAQAGGGFEDYLEKQREKAADYMEVYELLDSGEEKESYGDYAGAVQDYEKAKQKAAELYDKTARSEAAQKQKDAQETLSQMRQEQLDELEQKIQDRVVEEQAAQELENQALMNDKANALELEGKGNELLKNEDYASAAAYFETAMGMYADLGMQGRAQTMQDQIDACQKLKAEADRKAEEEKQKQAQENAAAQEAKQAAEDARQAIQDMKDSETLKTLEEVRQAAEDAQKAAEEARKAAEENKKDESGGGEKDDHISGNDVSGNGV